MKINPDTYNVKCDFTDKVSFNINDMDKKFGAHLVTKTTNVVWAPKQGPVNMINIIDVIEEKYGLIPGETKRDKVDWIRDNFIINENMCFVVKQKEER